MRYNKHYLDGNLYDLLLLLVDLDIHPGDAISMDKQKAFVKRYYKDVNGQTQATTAT